MAKVRVSTLAKEFGMTSKELMGHLAEMKIPAKSASSALEDAYVAMVRKQLASVIEARAQEVEAAKLAEEQAAAAEEAARAAEAERERIAAEKAREEERRQFAAAQAAEEAARAEAEAKKKAEQERLAREKEEAAREAQRRAVPASDSGSRFRSLLDQIAAQETVLKEKKDAEEKAKAERAAERGNRRGGNHDRRGGRRNDRNASDSNSERNASESRPHSHRTNASNNVAAGMDFPNPDKQGKGKKRKGGHNNEEDHYSRMAREAEEYSREKVLEEARAAVEEASRESTGRRKKRKEKREREAAKAQEERKIEEALAQGVNPEDLDAIKVSQGVTVQELTEYGIIPEEWGGQNMFVNISAKQKIGIDDLLETVLLQADVLELKANPDTFASGNVLEAKLDKGRGSVATVLVTRGTLHVGDTLVAGLTYGRVRAMLDPKGNAVTEAGPSDAVEILGLQSVPNAGDEFRVFEDEREARALADERSLKARIEEQSRVKHVTLENLFETIADAEVKELNLIIKADVQGSIEALQDSLDKMDQSEVRINTIHSAVGAINETDVVLADASNAIIIGFGVRPDGKARSAAEREGVEIRCYDVIYKCLEDLDAARIGMLKPTEVEVSTGTATVLDTFKVPKVGIAAGVRVEEGEIAATDSVRLVRDGIVVFNGKIASMRHYKDEAKSLKSGSEGGIGLENFQDIKPGDTIEGYRIDQVARTE